MRVLICGSRDYDCEKLVNLVLDGIYASGTLTYDNKLVVISGECPTGADLYATRWAKRHAGHLLCDYEGYPADWDKYGNAAGFIRNQQMAETDPDVVYAFTDKPLAESIGTDDMCRKARAAHAEVYHFQKLHLW